MQTRMRIYSLMDDPALIEAVRDLERTCSSFDYTAPPAKVRAEYEDMLDCAREELDRRVTL